MKVEPGSDGTMKILRIIPESPFDKEWLQEFIGGGGPADDWQFLERTNRKAEFRISATTINDVRRVEIGVQRVK